MLRLFWLSQCFSMFLPWEQYGTIVVRDVQPVSVASHLASAADPRADQLMIAQHTLPRTSMTCESCRERNRRPLRVL
jgi:hypothetical protein